MLLKDVIISDNIKRNMKISNTTVRKLVSHTEISLGILLTIAAITLVTDKVRVKVFPLFDEAFFDGNFD